MSWSAPATRPSTPSAAGDVAARLTFIPQQEPRGYGHAIYCARDFVGEQPFLHMVGDHLWVSRTAQGCAEQLLEVAMAEACAVSAVQASRETLLPYFGAVGGRRVPGRQDLYTVEDVIEKPTPTEAEQRLLVPGLRAGHYLCFFGMHVLTPALMAILARHVAEGQPNIAARAGAGRAGQQGALPGIGKAVVTLRRGREVRAADGPDGPGALGQGPRHGASRSCWSCWRSANCSGRRDRHG